MKRMFAITNRALTRALAFALAASVVLAQQPQTLKGVVIKGKTPVNKEVLKFTMPKAYETELGNGLRVIALENHKLPTFTMGMVILSGGLSDPAGQPGAAEYTASMLDEGTKTRSNRQIVEEVESLGTTISADSGLSSAISMITAGGLIKNFDQIMELFADVILNPSFPTDELNKLKTLTLAQLQVQRSQPEFLASEIFSKKMYGAHPAGRAALTPAQIQAITAETLKQFHAAHYKPNNAIFAIVGDINPSEIVAKLEKTFGGQHGSWTRGEVPQPDLPEISEPGQSKVYLIDRPGSEQTNLILGNLSIKRNDPDYYALKVMNQILGGGSSARLFLKLREEKRYTYGASSEFTAEKYRGVFLVNTSVQTKATKDAMDELINEFKRIRNEKTPNDEFDRAKRTIVGGFALALESPESLLVNIITQKFYNLPADYWDAYPQKIAAVTADDVQRVARKYLDLGKLQIVAIGDAKQIAGMMKKFGGGEIYETEGKPLQSPSAEPKTK